MSARSATAPQPVMTPTMSARPQRTRRLTLLSSARADGRLSTTGRVGRLDEETGAEDIFGTIVSDKDHPNRHELSTKSMGNFATLACLHRGRPSSIAPGFAWTTQLVAETRVPIG